MNAKITTALSLVAGFIGGAVSHYVFDAAPVRAQVSAMPTAEIRAQKFVLVDQGGVPRGAFGIETDGTVRIEATDSKGRNWLFQTYPSKFTWNGRPWRVAPKGLASYPDCRETMTKLAALNNMTTCQVIDQDVKLQFIRQLYEVCLERHGPDHEQTRILQEYITELETRDSS